MTKRIKLYGLGLALLALVLYLANTAAYACQNQWSSALSTIIGMNPFRPLSRPVWQMLMQVFAMLPGAGILVAGNFVNALLGAAAVWLSFLCGFRLLAQPKFARTEDEQSRIRSARLVAGLVTAAFLAVCSPMLVVATRANPLALDACLLLGVCLLTLVYRDRAELRFWYLFCALYGVGVSEFPTFIILSPFFAVYWGWLIWKSRKASTRMIGTGLALLAVGVSIGLLFCWFYYKSPAADWREFSSYFQVLKHFVLDQVNELRFGVPKQGWLVVFLSLILPAVFVFKSDYFADHDVFTKIGLYFFRLILVGVAVVVLFNLPGSPWHVVGSDVILITPYLVAALWIGQLIAFFYHAAISPSVDRVRRRNRKKNPLPRILVIASASAAVLVAGFRNTVDATPSRGEPLAEFSRDLLDTVGDAKYLLSNGSLDVTLMWEAVKRGQDLRVISPAQASSDAYRRYMVTWFDDPALESISVIGFIPFLDLWISGNPNITEELVIQGSPEIWSLQGFRWIPDRGVYRGADITAGGDAAQAGAVGSANASFLKKYEPVFGFEAARPVLLEREFDSVGRFLSVFANNAGYKLLSAGNDGQAEDMFRTALRYDPVNLSAMLNMGEVASVRDDEVLLEEFRDMYNRRVALSEAPTTPRQLMRRFGYVRNHAMFVSDAVAMVEAGLKEEGMRIIDESMSFDSDALDADMQVARVLFGEGRVEESLELYESILSRDVSNTEALAGVARCHLMLGNTDEADQKFALLEDLGAPAGRVAMERGYVKLRTGDYPGAIDEFTRGLDDEDSQGASAVGLVWAGLRANNPEAVLKGESVLERLPRYYAGQMTLYELAMQRRDTVAAYEHIVQVLRIQPGNASAIEKAIRLELLEGRETEAKALLDRLLSIDSSNAYGNYLLSSIHEREGRLDLAETALRTALRSGPRADVYYGLAWVLEKQGRVDEALDNARRAVKLQPGNPQYVAIEGMVLASFGAFAEAESRLRQAIELRTDREIPLFRLHLARALRGQGKEDESREILDEYLADSTMLTDDERAVLDALTTSR